MRRRGSVLLIAITLSGLFLSIGFVLVSSSLKEAKQNSIVAKSFSSFSITDSAYECALYQDFRQCLFNGFTCDGNERVIPSRFSCAGKDPWNVIVNNMDSNGEILGKRLVIVTRGRLHSNDQDKSTYSFFIGDQGGDKPCARVCVIKYCKERYGDPRKSKSCEDRLGDRSIPDDDNDDNDDGCTERTIIEAIGFDRCESNRVGSVQRRLYVEY